MSMHRAMQLRLKYVEQEKTGGKYNECKAGLVRLVELCITVSFLCPFSHSQIHTRLDPVDTKTKHRQTDIVTVFVGW